MIVNSFLRPYGLQGNAMSPVIHRRIKKNMEQRSTFPELADLTVNQVLQASFNKMASMEVLQHKNHC